MMLRRSFATACAVLPAVASARSVASPLPAPYRWLLGSWHSDVELTMQHFTFQVKRPSPELRARVAEMFGKMTHTYTPTRFIVEERIGAQVTRLETAYRVERFTQSSVSLSYPGARGMPDATLYRGDGFYFVRSGANFEYFRRVSG